MSSTIDIPSPASWTDIVIKAVVELQEQFDSQKMTLSDTERDDFSHLFDGAQRLQALIAQPENEDTSHDLMNVLSAIRGYAEMLREYIGQSHPALNDVLARLLSTVHTVHADETEVQSSEEVKVIASEPGFILAVDDLQENRELVARYLSRIGLVCVIFGAAHVINRIA